MLISVWLPTCLDVLDTVPDVERNCFSPHILIVIVLHDSFVNNFAPNYSVVIVSSRFDTQHGLLGSGQLFKFLNESIITTFDERVSYLSLWLGTCNNGLDFIISGMLTFLVN